MGVDIVQMFLNTFFKRTCSNAHILQIAHLASQTIHYVSRLTTRIEIFICINNKFCNTGCDTTSKLHDSTNRTAFLTFGTNVMVTKILYSIAAGSHFNFGKVRKGVIVTRLNSSGSFWSKSELQGDHSQ